MDGREELGRGSLRGAGVQSNDLTKVTSRIGTMRRFPPSALHRLLFRLDGLRVALIDSKIHFGQMRVLEI